MHKNKILIILLMLLVNLSCFAEEANDSKSDGDKTEYLILPFAYYNPATSFGFGVYSMFLFKENLNKDRSKLRTELSYTLKNQIIFRYKSLFYLESSKLSTKANVKKFISNYYGLSNNSDIDKEEFSYFSTDFFLDYSNDFRENISYSILYDFDMIKIAEFEDDGMLYRDGFADEELIFNHGFGFGLSYERISKKFFRNGISTDIKFLISSEYFGSNNNFSVLESDVKYFLFYKQSSINLQFISRFSFDNVPLTKLSTLGGSNNLRGYPDKRFTDNNMLLFQSEYDFRIYKKIAGSIFYSLGDVFDPFSDLKFSKIKQGYGFGILYELLGTAIRFDVATFPENKIQIIATGSRAF